MPPKPYATGSQKSVSSAQDEFPVEAVPDPVPMGTGNYGGYAIPAEDPNESAPAAPLPEVPTSSYVQAPVSVSMPPAQPVSTTGYTQMGSLPEGYSTRPAALPSSTAQYFLPTLINTQQAIREWERRMNYPASTFGGAQLLYQPVLLTQLAVRYLDRKTNVEEDQRWAFHVPNLDKAGLVRWSDFQATPIDPSQVASEPFGDAFYGVLPAGLTDTKRLAALKTDVVDYVYRSASLVIYHNTTLDVYGSPRDNRRDFMLKIQQKAREARDEEIDATTKKYDREFERLEEKLKREQRSHHSEKQTLESLKREDLYTTGEAVLSLLKGRTTYTLSRMSRTRRYKNAAQERALASEQALADIEDQIERRQKELQDLLKEVNDKWAKVSTEAEELKITPYKKDITLEIFGIGWIPTWYVVLNNQPVMLPAFGSSAS